MNAHRSTVLAVAAGILAVPAPALATTVRGKVVERDAAARTIVLAERDGDATRVLVPRKSDVPAVGRSVKASGPLRAGTLRASSIRVLGGKRAKTARLGGVVTNVDTAAGTYTLEFGTVTVTIAIKDGSAPEIGQVVKLVVRLLRGDIVEHRAKVEGRRSFEVEGMISAVDRSAGTVTITPEDDEDDDDEVRSPITLKADARLLDGLEVGQEVEAKVVRRQDGTLEALKIEAEDGKGRGHGDHRGTGDDHRGRGHDRGDD